MATLPASGYFANSSLTVANLRTGLEDVRDCIEQIPGSKPAEEVEVDTYVLEVTGLSGWVRALKGAGIGGDTIETITAGLPDGHFLIVECSPDYTDTLLLKQNPAVDGGLNLKGLASLETMGLAPGEWVLFYRKDDGGSTTWVEFFRKTAATHHQHVVYEALSPNSSAVTFDIANAFIEGTIEVVYDNTPQRPTTDFTEDGPGAQITMTFTPETGHWLFVKYAY